MQLTPYHAKYFAYELTRIMRRELFDSQDNVDREKENLLKETEDRLKQRSTREELFTTRWRLT